MAECMENAEVVKKVLENISSTELLGLSLVNKLWNYEGRSLMRERGDVTARTIKGHSSCQHLKNLALDAKEMAVVPFRGICIELRGANCAYRDGCPPEELDLLYGNIFDRVQHKHLSVSLFNGWEIHNNCPGLGLVKKILKNPESGLEELSVLLECEQSKLFVQKALENSNLRSLKTFKLEKNDLTAREDYTDLVKVLVSRAPNLQVLYTGCRVNLQANLLAGSSAVHVTNYGYCAIREIPESVAGELRMKKILVGHPIPRLFNLERFSRVTPMLLQNSRLLLNKVEINAIFLVPLMRYAICLENVKDLVVFVDSSILERSQEQLLSVMKNFDFTRIFPHLVNFVAYIYTSPRYLEPLSQVQINEMAEAWNGPLEEPQLDRAVNIKSIFLILQSPLEELACRFLAEMLPDVERIHINSTALNIPFTLLWHRCWLNLKKMTVIMRGRSSVGRHNVNLDDEFCGIHPEEVEFLRGQSDEYLREVNIVPVAPSISSLKGLRTFRLLFEEQDSLEGPVDDATYLFSKVTGLVAFKRCPDLTVSLKLQSQRVKQREDLRHLEPYVSLVSYSDYGFYFDA